MSAPRAPRWRIAAKAEWPGVSKNVTGMSFEGSRTANYMHLVYKLHAGGRHKLVMPEKIRSSPSPSARAYGRSFPSLLQLTNTANHTQCQ